MNYELQSPVSSLQSEVGSRKSEVGRSYRRQTSQEKKEVSVDETG